MTNGRVRPPNLSSLLCSLLRREQRQKVRTGKEEARQLIGSGEGLLGKGGAGLRAEKIKLLRKGITGNFTL